MSLFQSWRDAYLDLEDECPWPGPRPLTASDLATHALYGRADHIADFVTSVLDHSLVVLHGDSGVGKSSLLNVGLLASLRRRGYTLRICNDWSHIDRDTALSAEEFIRAKLAAAGTGDDLVDPTGDLIDDLSRRFGDRVVIVFDQFEEMIRYEREMFDALVSWVLDANARSRIRIVLSLRSEYLHELRELDARAKPFSMGMFDLPPVTDLDAIGRLIGLRSPFDDDDPDSVPPIDPLAEQELVKAWSDLGESNPERGLLMLQATLYVLHDLSRIAGRDVVNLDDVRTLRQMERTAVGGRPLGLFETGLDESVQVKLRRCKEACDDQAVAGLLDAGMVAGVHGLIRRGVRSLTSGGYKLVREQWDLVSDMLRRELEVLKAGAQDQVLDQFSEQVFRALSRRVEVGPDDKDFLEVTRGRLLEDLAQEDSDGGDPGPAAGAREEAQREDLTSGLMMGRAEGEVMVEEVRRAVFALEWLNVSSITRTIPLGGLARVSLIHDGFGQALERWASAERADADAVLSRFVATTGGFLHWKTLGLLNGKPTEPRLHVNLRWRHCEVRIDVEHAVFVNCDFRNSRFVDCSFNGVVFLNCLMDNVVFDNCTITGTVRMPTEADNAEARNRSTSSAGLPSFLVPGSAGVATVLARYQELPDATDTTFSKTSGLPALPEKIGPSELANVVAWEAETGGLAMYGGRLSSMMVKSCHFTTSVQADRRAADDGMPESAWTPAFAIRHVAGSSLDLVEQTEGDFLIFDSTIRGFSISPPLPDEEQTETEQTETEQTKPRIRLAIRESAVVDTWFSPRLRGHADLRGNSVWQLLNASSNGDFQVHLRDCGWSGVVNATSIDTPPWEGYDALAITDLSRLESVSREMIYRSDPARHELEARRRREGGA